MKKAISLLLALVLCLSLCACGETRTSDNPTEEAILPSEETESPSAWFLTQSTDEFGDVTEDSVKAITGIFSGTFSNTATSESELTVVVSFAKKPDYNHYIALFDLKEYNDTNAIFHSGDELIFKMKIGDEIITDYMTGEEPNGSLCLGVNEYSWGGDLLYNALYEGKDVRCIITIGSSEYKFTLISDDFTSTCEQIGFGRGAAGLTLREAVKVFLDDKGTSITYTEEWFAKNYEKIERMNSQQITELLEGTFLQIWFGASSVDPFDGSLWFPHWKMAEYSFSTNSGVMKARYLFDNDLANVFSEARQNGETIIGYAGWRSFDPQEGTPFHLSVENDLYMEYYENSDLTLVCQCRKLTDNMFLVCWQTDDGSFEPAYLLLRANGATHDDLNEAIVYAHNVSLYEIEE